MINIGLYYSEILLYQSFICQEIELSFHVFLHHPPHSLLNSEISSTRIHLSEQDRESALAFVQLSLVLWSQLGYTYTRPLL